MGVKWANVITAVLTGGKRIGRQEKKKHIYIHIIDKLKMKLMNHENNFVPDQIG